MDPQASNGTAKPGATLSGQQALTESKEFDETTAMLVTVLILFLITQLPPSIAVFLEVCLDEVYYFECRRSVHYLILMMYSISGSFNFFVYVSMSKNYRDTLLNLSLFRIIFKGNPELQKMEDTLGSGESTLIIDTQM